MAFHGAVFFKNDFNMSCFNVISRPQQCKWSIAMVMVELAFAFESGTSI